MKKRILAIVLLLVFALTACVACKPAEPEESVDPYESLVAARKYLKAIYKDGATKTEEDYAVAAQVPVNDEIFPVTWTVELPEGAPENTVVVETSEENPGLVIINIDEEAAKDYEYILTASVSKDDRIETVSFNRLVPAGAAGDMSPAEALVQAFALETGAAMKSPTALRGEIVAIPTAYSEDYGNITVNIQIGDKVVQCYRLTGGKELKIGDVITVYGTIKNYNGTIEFDKGCVYSFDQSEADMMQVATLEKAFALEENTAMKTKSALRGEIVEIPTPYSEDYGNITVNIQVGDKKVQCYRLAGGKELKVGDVITVIGLLKNYKGTVEFDAKCTYSYDMTVAEAKGIIVAEQAQAIEEGAAMKGLQTMTGVITDIPTAYSADYGNITVNIQVGDYKIQCYRLAGGEDLAVGDKITVTGTLKNYKGTIEFDAKCTYTK